MPREIQKEEQMCCMQEKLPSSCVYCAFCQTDAAQRDEKWLSPLFSTGFIYTLYTGRAVVSRLRHIIRTLPAALFTPCSQRLGLTQTWGKKTKHFIYDINETNFSYFRSCKQKVFGTHRYHLCFVSKWIVQLSVSGLIILASEQLWHPVPCWP